MAGTRLPAGGAAVLVLFLDESGDHSLTVIDPQYPMFVLGGVIMDQAYAEGEAEDRVRQFKRELFGSEDVILHTADLTRNRNGFEQMAEPVFRQRFYAGLNELMRTLDYQVVACAIRKDAHLRRYGLAAIDPYLLSLDVIVERFCFAIGDRLGGGAIVVEQRDATLNHELQLAWLGLTIRGTARLQASVVSERITGLTLRAKRENIAGLQLADLVVSPIGRFVLGKPVREDFRIVEGKFRRRGGRYEDEGLVVLPKGEPG